MAKQLLSAATCKVFQELFGDLPEDKQTAILYSLPSFPHGTQEQIEREMYFIHGEIIARVVFGRVASEAKS